mmetsp:Transcript_4420/g.7387  ORF Transcript_4420/g.7387 Transcript_4420/m.7387 type:complete len:419 (+) Transcript_4420:56-1312(+)
MAAPKIQNQNQNQADTNNGGLHVVICGGGVIGCCTAYYLAQKANVQKVTIVERYKIAGCASGKAGGFLALDWCDGGWMQALTRKSFALHTELGKQFGNRYQYRPTVAYAVNTKYTDTPSSCKKSDQSDLSWIDCEIQTKCEVLGTRHTNAQIHPALFCQTLCELMADKLSIVYGTVTRMVFDKNNQQKVAAVEYNRNEQICTVACDAVVIALGPWSKQAHLWFPECVHLQHVTGSIANSIVVQPTYNNCNASEHKQNDDDEAVAQRLQCLDGGLFLNHVNRFDDAYEIEVYPRPDGTVYACSHSKDVALPDDPSTITHDQRDSDMLHQTLQELSSGFLAHSQVTIKQACYLPSTVDNVPLIGRVTNYENAYVGTGHTCWGILNAPATGLLLSELIADGKISSFDSNAVQRWTPSRDLN